MRREVEIRRLLAGLAAPDEVNAQRRSWQVVRAAFAEREPLPWRRRNLRPVLVLATAIAVVAAVLSPPGRAVLDELRETIGRERVVGVEQAQPALFRLPARGQVLAASRRGSWIVQPDGSKRLLRGYREPAWSPHGIYVAAIRGSELVALDPKGRLRWSLARPLVALPTWTGDRRDTRVAYLSGLRQPRGRSSRAPVRWAVRVVGGDGRGDRLLSPNGAHVRPAWRPGPERHLAFVERRGSLRVVDADTGRPLWRAARVNAKSATLEWSDDGRRLLLADGRRVRVFDARGRLVRSHEPRRGHFVLDATFRPGSHAFAYSTVHPPTGRGRVHVAVSASREVFAGAGWFANLAWAPSGRWLGLTWDEANQWVFLRVAGQRVRQVEAVSNISAQLGTHPYLAGWCCASSR